MSDPLSIWTIYRDPSESGYFVARRFEYDRLTKDKILAQDITKLRAEFLARGMVVIPRDHADDPRIVESWL